jgi:hypothetical protein
METKTIVVKVNGVTQYSSATDRGEMINKFYNLKSSLRDSKVQIFEETSKEITGDLV